jgi:DNA repair protein RadC
MTKRVKVACDAVGIRFYDHLIIGKGAETSMHEKGLMW